MIGETFGHYEIIAKLGEGGMGEVFQARDTKLGRDVALKLLPAAFTADADRHTRFHREAQILATFAHPHVAAIHSIEDFGDQHFLVLELVDGEDLSDRLARGPLPIDEALECARQIATALEAAHPQGIVHRDLKPQNVKYAADGQIKVLDFGLAKACLASDESTPNLDKSTSPTFTGDLSRTGIILGTAGYMSPEQARGQPVDKQTDIWAFGCLLYEMLTGRKAFDGETVSDTLVAVLQFDPDWEALPADLQPTVIRLLHRCLQKDRQHRLHDIADARIEIEEVLSGEVAEVTAVEAARTSFSQADSRRSRPVGLIVLAVAGWLMVAGWLVAWLMRTPEPHVPVRMQTLTYSGQDWAPVVSPAGDIIVFVSARDGVSRIWRKQMAGGGEEPITEGRDDHPRFSPDGSQILFVRDRGGLKDLYRVSVVGSQLRKIMSDVQEADWSPDGNQVAYLRMRPVGEVNVTDIGVADVQTGDERILGTVENRLCYSIRWSPSGERIVFCETSLTGMISEDSFVNLVDLATGTMERLDLTVWAGPYSALEWSPTGRSFVVGQSADVLGRVSDAASQVMEFDLASRTTRALFWSPLQVPMGGRSYSTIAVLSSDQLVIDEYTMQSGLQEIAWPGAGETLPAQTLTRSLGRDRQPVYSPDGTRVLLSSNRSGNIDLWILDLSTRVLHQITDDPADDWDPAFTPDGQSVLWSSNRGGHMEVWLANADGSGARQVTHDGVDAENPTMTRDGEWILYGSSNAAASGIWKIRPDGTEATVLAEGSHFVPEVSPDGRYAVFLYLRGMVYVIKAVEVTTGELVDFEIVLEVKELHQNVVFGRARWTPDGQSLVYLGQDEQGRSGIYVQDFVPGRDTSASRWKLAGFTHEYTLDSFGLTPDGQSVVISTLVDHRTLKLVENVPLSGW